MGNEQNQGLDPQIQTFTKAIALQEGGGKLASYDAPSGDVSNATGGRYQIIPDTWKKYAGEILGNSNAPMTPENQNQVAYSKFKNWHDQGYSFAQMASMWNAGEGAPDSWKPGTHQESGDTPNYVKNVQKYAQMLASGGQMPQTQLTSAQIQQQETPNNGLGALNTNIQPINQVYQSTETPGETSQPQGLGGTLADAGKGIVNFAFPILGDITADAQGQSTKSALQQLGDAGLSALWFVPGVGELGEAALDAARLTSVLGETGARVAGQALGNAALGYGADVSSNLSQGQTGAQALKPGPGMVTGGVLGAAMPSINRATKTILPVLSERPQAAFDTMIAKPNETKTAIKAGITAQDVLKTGQNAVRNFRKTLTQDWQNGVKGIVGEFTGNRMSLSDPMVKKLQTVADEFGLDLPQNPKNMSALETVTLLKKINELPNKILTESPKGALTRSVRDDLKTQAIASFGGKDGSLAALYKNYSTRKGILDAAASLLQPYKLDKPKTQQTALNLMTSLFNGNKSEYLKTIKQLEQATGQDITGKAAALQFQQKMPSFGKVLSPNILGGGWELLKGILAAPLSSPRGAAVLSRSLAGKGGTIGRLLTQSAKTGVIRGASALPSLLPSSPQ